MHFIIGDREAECTIIILCLIVTIPPRESLSAWYLRSGLYLRNGSISQSAAAHSIHFSSPLLISSTSSHLSRVQTHARCLVHKSRRTYVQSLLTYMPLCRKEKHQLLRLTVKKDDDTTTACRLESACLLCRSCCICRATKAVLYVCSPHHSPVSCNLSTHLLSKNKFNTRVLPSFPSLTAQSPRFPSSLTQSPSFFCFSHASSRRLYLTPKHTHVTTL